MKFSLAPFIFLLLLGVSFSQLWGNYSYVTDILQDQSAYGASSPYAGTPWVQNYRILALLAALALIVGTALAYFAGGALESESLKSWGRVELAQALATAFLVAAFLGVLTLMDAVMEESAKNIIPPCGVEGTWDYANAKPMLPPNAPSILPKGSPRALQYAVCYLDSIYGLAGKQAEGDLKSSLTFMRMAYTSQGMQGTNWWSLWFGFYSRPNAEMRLQGEMSGLQFDMVKNMMISLQAQKFLVGRIAAVLGPTFLLIGIILRTLPFTRRAGGMMLAISLGLLVILPSAYLLAWSTLVVAVYGNSVLGGPSEDLPDGMPDACESCRKLVPVVFDASSNPPKSITAPEYPALLISDADGNPLDYSDAAAIADYNKRTGKNYQACYPNKDTPGQTVGAAASKGCPELCRELPFPAYKQICNELSCGQLPEQCKVIRWINQTHFDATKTPYCEKWDENLAFGCEAACTNECKALLPQINATDAVTMPKVTENSCAECASCPLRCKVYSTSNGERLSTGDARCDAADCLPCYKNTGKFIACSIGMSPLSSSEGCNSASLCGPATALASIKIGQDGKPQNTNVCPLECRVYFDKGKEGFRDPLYVKMCDKQGNDEGPFYKACTRCPNSCKVNASLVGAYDPLNPQEFLLKPQTGSCSAAPIFDQNGKMVKDKCTYCPMACRFVNPSPVDVAADPFLSHANFNISCAYLSNSRVSGQSSDKSGCKILQQAQGYDTSEIYTGFYRLAVDGKDWCSPTDRVYKLASQPPHKLCPAYYYSANMVDDPSGQYKLVNISPQQRAAPECLLEGVKEACADAKCPPAECKSDWPAFCTLLPPINKYSKIVENEQGSCSACKNLNNPINTTGPQCQVTLKYDGLVPEHPTLCDPKCYDATCKQGCFPELKLPEGQQPNGNICGSYSKINDWKKDEDKWKDCAACPYDCRYDYAGSPPGRSVGYAITTLSDWCGMDLLSNLSQRDMGPPVDPNQKYWICPNLDDFKFCEKNSVGRVVPQIGTWAESELRYQIPLSECTAQGYSCTLRTSQIEYWACTPYRNPNPPSDPCHGFFLKDNSHPQDWWVNNPSCGPNTDCELLNPYAQEFYDCTYSDPYPGLNTFLKDKLGVTVCGVLEDKSTVKNWCGNATYNRQVALSCDMRLESDGGCVVEYDARAKFCSGVNWNQGPPPDKTGCQWCPPACRIKTLDNPPKYAYCPQYSLASQQDTPACDSESCKIGCRVTAGIPKPPANFSLEPGVCEAPHVGSGKFCPARCRTYYEGWTGTQDWAQYCNNPAEGIDCSDLTSQCQAPIGSRACEACSRCETDCLARPYVRQNCDEVCQTQGEVLDFNPAKMIGRWGDGVDAWPEHRTIASLGIAAVVLPLFALVITMAFVRVLSPFLGGDIEIPGLMRFL